MSDQNEAFLRSIIAVPEDDNARLVFADWLEENSDPIPCPTCDVSPGVRRYPTHGGDWIEDDCNVCSGAGRVENTNRFRAAYIRESIEYDRWFDPHEAAPLAVESRKRLADLLAAWWPGYWPLRPVETPDFSCDYLYLKNSCGVAALSGPGKPGHRVVMHRGFASELICTANQWGRHADQIAWRPDWKTRIFPDTPRLAGSVLVGRACRTTANPIQRVVLTTMPIVNGWGGWGTESLAATATRDEYTHVRWPGVTFVIHQDVRGVA